MESELVCFALDIARQIDERIVLAVELLENRESPEAKAIIEKELIQSLGRIRDRGGFRSIH